MQTYRWGIVGSGNMASRMAVTLGSHPRASLAGFVTTSSERGELLGSTHGVAVVEDLADLAADVVYIASVSSRHHADVAAAIDAGVAVLCEKPFGVNLDEVLDLHERARRRRVFVMEAMWSRFLPVGAWLRARIEAGDHVDARLVQSALGYRVDRDPARRWFGDAAGAGVMLDLGVYGLDLALQVLGPPSATDVTVTRDGGVVSQAAVVGTHARGALSVTTVSFDGALAGGASIVSPTCTDVVVGEFQRADRIDRTTVDGVTSIDLPYSGEGLAPEVDEVHATLDRGAVESTVLPHQATEDLHRWLDRIAELTDRR